MSELALENKRTMVRLYFGQDVSGASLECAADSDAASPHVDSAPRTRTGRGVSHLPSELALGTGGMLRIKSGFQFTKRSVTRSTVNARTPNIWWHAERPSVAFSCTKRTAVGRQDAIGLEARALRYGKTASRARLIAWASIVDSAAHFVVKISPSVSAVYYRWPYRLAESSSACENFAFASCWQAFQLAVAQLEAGLLGPDSTSIRRRTAP